VFRSRKPSSIGTTASETVPALATAEPITAVRSSASSNSSVRLDSPEHSDANQHREPSATSASGTAGGISRRAWLKTAGVGAAGLGAAGVLAVGSQSRGDAKSAKSVSAHDFYGQHQSGIVTAAQDRLHFAAFDVTTSNKSELIALLKEWTAAADAMMAGRPIGVTGAVDGAYDLPPEDTGEALDLEPARLTITFGFGPTLFNGPLGDRFGLGPKQPVELAILPHFPADNLNPDRSNGDLCIQACADDPQVAVHAIRNLARIGFGRVAIRWSQLGFGRTSSTSTSQVTPRNLFGFKDGTANLKTEDADATLAEHVWVQPIDSTEKPGDASWLTGGSYLVARRISMKIEPWDRTPLREQENLIGRTKGSGAPLSGGTEFSPMDFAMKGRGDLPIVAEDSHIRMAHPTQNNGVRLLRRGYNFTDGTDGLGRLDAGLFFIAFVRDPAKQYIPMQTKMSKQDGLMEYLQHTGSALFAVPPGVTKPGGFIGETLFT
jgi:deferrochelatase/peroxidase EfeB